MLELEKDHVLSEAERHLVSDAMEAVLATEKFEAAPQMSAFFRYVVEQAANGNQSRIKAFTVAVDALGKPDSFDPQNDPVVRVLAGRLRAALAAYNEEYPDASMIITMTPGSYVPTFRRQTAKLQTSLDEVSQTSGNAQNSDQHEQKRLGGNSLASDQGSDPSILETDEVSSNDTPLESCEVAARDNIDVTPENAFNPLEALKPGKRSRPNRHSGLLYGDMHLGKLYSLFTVPRALLAGAIAGLVWVGMARDFQNSDADPAILAATPVPGTDAAPSAIRARPDIPSVFVSAINQGNALENSLNAIVSSAIAESDQVQVYRILQTDSNIGFWPEDYVLTLTALDLPDEKRVNMQLMEADSGRIVHSRAVPLDEQADDQLTQTELDQLIDAAKSMVSKSGPLVQHYNARQR